MTESGQEGKVQQLCLERAALIDQCHTYASAVEWCASHSRLADRLVRTVVDDVSNQLGRLPPLSIVATGGYGRSELSPFSDVDITLIPFHEGDPAIDVTIRRIFRGLHDAFHDFGLSVGYAYRLIADAPGLDADSRTGLLDARLIAGDEEPMRQLQSLLWETFPTGDFLVAKLRERERDWSRTNDTPLVVEPDLKLGAGGLRCTHTANWIRAALGEPEIEPSAAYEAILRSRNLLHVVSKRANDRFTRARQAEVADLANRSMMEWISELCESLDANHRDYLATLRWLRSRRFALGSHLYLDSGTLFADGNPTLLDAASAVAIAVELGMDSHSIANVNTDDPKGGPLVQILAQGEPVNRALDRTGLLAAMLPELDRCRYLMPSDASHSYTVFEHTFRVVRNLDAPPEGFLSEIKASLGSPATLYLAALLHDTGKAVPGERHSIAGERLARDVAQRWNLDDAIAQDVAWLVREHLTMAHMIRLRDVYHQATAYEFAEVVRSLDRLQMLTLLTWADIAAVNAEAWTAVQDELLKELYERTRWVLESDASDLPDPDQFRRRLRAAAEPDDDSEALAAFVDSLPGHYLLSNDSATIYSHYRSYRKALEGEPSISLMAKSEIGASELTVCCPDVPGLLHRILGTLYAHDLSLHGLRACTTQSQPAIAIDVFTVGFAGRPIPQATAARLIQNLMGILNNHRTVEDVLREHGKDPARRQEDFRWQFVPGEPAIIEFTAPRGRGMPYRLSHAIALQGWNVLAARVGQWAGKGTASFYVEGRGGQPLTAHDVEQALRQQV